LPSLRAIVSFQTSTEYIITNLRSIPQLLSNRLVFNRNRINLTHVSVHYGLQRKGQDFAVARWCLSATPLTQRSLAFAASPLAMSGDARGAPPGFALNARVGVWALDEAKILVSHAARPRLWRLALAGTLVQIWRARW